MVFNTKISEVQNKIPDDSKYITTQEFYKLTAENFAAKLNPADLMNKTDFDNKLTSFNKRITSNKTKHLEVQKKQNSLITKDIFLAKIYSTSNDWSQNRFVYRPALDDVELKEKTKGTDYVVGWKSKGILNPKLKPLYTAFLHSIKLSKYRIGIKFDKDPLVLDQSNYLAKIENVYIIYNLDTRPRNTTNNFKFKKWLFGAII